VEERTSYKVAFVRGVFLHLAWNCDRGVGGCMVGMMLPKEFM